MRPNLSHRNRPRLARAFTLIEMMVVLALIAILTAMIIPELKGTFEDALLRSTGRDLVNVIELASSRAISLNQTLRVSVDAASGRYQVERLRRRGMADDFAPLDGISGTSGQLDKRIVIEIQPAEVEPADASDTSAPPLENTEPALTFHPDGTADGATILLRDRAGFRLSLRVNPVTSRVTISEPAHE